MNFVRSLWISEQTETCALQNIKKIGFYNRGGDCLQRGTD